MTAWKVVVPYSKTALWSVEITQEQQILVLVISGSAWAWEQTSNSCSTSPNLWLSKTMEPGLDCMCSLLCSSCLRWLSLSQSCNTFEVLPPNPPASSCNFLGFMSISWIKTFHDHCYSISIQWLYAIVILPKFHFVLPGMSWHLHPGGIS